MARALYSPVLLRNIYDNKNCRMQIWVFALEYWYVSKL